METGPPYTMLQQNNNKEKSDLVLSIHVHVNGFSFFTHHKSTQKAGLIYRKTFTETVPIEKLHNEIHADLKKQHILDKHFDEVRCCVENNLATLVPKPLFEEASLHDYVKSDIDVRTNDFVTHDNLQNIDWITVYVPYVNVNNMLIDAFGSFTYFHAVSVWLRALSKHSKADGEFVWSLYKENNHIHVALLQHKKLQFYNCFEAKNPKDIAYFVLLTAEKHGFSPNEVPLYVVGDIAPEDATYKALYTFVRSINFLDPEHTYIFESSRLNAHQEFCLLNLF